MTGLYHFTLARDSGPCYHSRDGPDRSRQASAGRARRLQEALIGRGGMGRVYRARHLALDRVVAVKLVDQTNNAALSASVLAEARAAAKLDDPHVVAVYEVGEEKGVPYHRASSGSSGVGLDARVKRQELPARSRSAGDHARDHARPARGTAARARALRREAGEYPRGSARLGQAGGLQRGIARQADSALGAGETVSGSFHFMAPEQGGRWARPPDPRADLYAAGIHLVLRPHGPNAFPRPRDRRADAPPRRNAPGRPPLAGRG